MSWPADASMAHRALLYTDEPEFRAAVGAFIREGLDRREQILAAVPAGQLAWLRGELGGDVPAVEFADAASFYRRQGQATRATLDWLRRYASDGQRVRVVAGQAVSRRTPAEAADYLRMEAAANVVYQPFPVSVLCPYDVSVLPGDLRPGVEQTHPELLQGDRVVPSPAFADPRIFIRDFSAVVPPPLTSASIGFGRREDLAGVRRFLRTQLAQAGFGDEAAALLLAAAAEVVTNALMHGTAPRRALGLYRGAHAGLPRARRRPGLRRSARRLPRPGPARDSWSRTLAGPPGLRLPRSGDGRDRDACAAADQAARAGRAGGSPLGSRRPSPRKRESRPLG